MTSATPSLTDTPAAHDVFIRAAVSIHADLVKLAKGKDLMLPGISELIAWVERNWKGDAKDGVSTRDYSMMWLAKRFLETCAREGMGK